MITSPMEGMECDSWIILWNAAKNSFKMSFFCGEMTSFALVFG
jgi:hypothetical protein